VENLLGNLFGSPQQRQDYQDFVQRYDQGPPSQGYTGQEVLDRYQQIAPNLSPDAYQQSAAEAFARLSPQERQEFANFLRQRMQEQHVSFPDLNRDGVDDRIQQDPNALAQLTSRLNQQQPGLLEQLLGGERGSTGQIGAILENPLAKAALAGIAAAAAKQFMDRRAA
jgi:hypothetical protein